MDRDYLDNQQIQAGKNVDYTVSAAALAEKRQQEADQQKLVVYKGMVMTLKQASSLKKIDDEHKAEARRLSGKISEKLSESDEEAFVPVDENGVKLREPQYNSKEQNNDGLEDEDLNDIPAPAVANSLKNDEGEYTKEGLESLDLKELRKIYKSIVGKGVGVKNTNDKEFIIKTILS